MSKKQTTHKKENFLFWSQRHGEKTNMQKKKPTTL